MGIQDHSAWLRKRRVIVVIGVALLVLSTGNAIFEHGLSRVINVIMIPLTLLALVLLLVAVPRWESRNARDKSADGRKGVDR